MRRRSVSSKCSGVTRSGRHPARRSPCRPRGDRSDRRRRCGTACDDRRPDPPPAVPACPGRCACPAALRLAQLLGGNRRAVRFRGCRPAGRSGRPRPGARRTPRPPRSRSPAEAEVHLALHGLLGDRDRRHAQHNSSSAAATAARVGDVVAEVRAVVDAGDDQLRLEPDQAQSREPHAVHGRAVGREAGRAVAELHFLDPQRLPRRDAPRAGRPVRIRRDHRQLDAWNRQQRAPQRGRWPGCRRRS